MYTNQSLFETVSRHLFAQGERAFAPMSGCQYRTEAGLSCAIGCLIPDEMYRPAFEGRSVTGLLGSYPEIKGLFPDVHETLLEDLQQIHDMQSSWESSETLTNLLISVGIAHGLSVTFIDGLYFGMHK